LQPPPPTGVTGLEYWLHNLLLHSRENASSYVLGDIITSVCRASAVYCFALAKRAKDEGAPAAASTRFPEFATVEAREKAISDYKERRTSGQSKRTNATLAAEAGVDLSDLNRWKLGKVRAKHSSTIPDRIEPVLKQMSLLIKVT
jgi:hypothetical protein